MQICQLSRIVYPLNSKRSLLAGSEARLVLNWDPDSQQGPTSKDLTPSGDARRAQVVNGTSFQPRFMLGLFSVGHRAASWPVGLIIPLTPQ